MVKKEILIGVAAGVAIAALAPAALLLSAGGSRRSFVRAFARGGRVLTEKARETFAEFQEIAEDLTAELRATEAAASATGAAHVAAPAGASQPPDTTSQPAPPGAPTGS